VLKPVQIAYHVADPAAAARESAALHGWGPFYLLEHIPLASCVYRGAPSAFDHTSAYGQAGELMVEFITQHGDAPSVVRDVYAAGETGLHHVAHFVPDLAAALSHYDEAGLPTAMRAATADGVTFAMVDATATLGHMLELYEPVPALVQFYGYVRRKSQGWDGRDPVRRIAL